MWTAIGRQLRHPSGFTGTLVGYMMGALNRESNRTAIEALHLAPGDTILELGSGPGRAVKMAAAMSPKASVLGIDHSITMLVLAGRHNRNAIRVGRVRLLCARFEALPFRTDSIDKILAVHVVYFTDADAIRETKRVLRPGGRIVVLATDRYAMQNCEFAKTGTHRLFDRDELTSLLFAGGFAADAIMVSPITLRFGIPALLGVATKFGESLRPKWPLTV
jgi:ubiquinone/menaquinone biosynthesis C-methylase UbiE